MKVAEDLHVLMKGLSDRQLFPLAVLWN